MAVIAVIGSREYENMAQVREKVLGLPSNTVLVTGAWWTDWAGGTRSAITPTRGVDRVAAEAGREAGFTVVVVAADFARYKKQAGFRRNPTIIDLADMVIAFWDGQSRGTLSGLEYCKRKEKDLDVYSPKGYRFYRAGAE